MHRWGMYAWACNTAGTYLAAEQPSMVRYREQWTVQQAAAHVLPALRMKYAMMWKSQYRAPQRNTRKQRAKLGKLRKDRRLDPKPLPKNLAFKRKVKNAYSHSDGREGKTHKTMEDDARYGMIQNYREAGTLVTSTYANGTQKRGILVQVYADGACPANSMEEHNNTSPGEHFIIGSETTTHCMDADSTLLYFQRAVNNSMKRQREQNGVSHATSKRLRSQRMPPFSSKFAHCQGEERRRERKRWCDEANATQAEKPPGGWSASGGTLCDAFHVHFRKRIDRHTDMYLGDGSDRAARCDLSFEPRNVTGVVKRQRTIRTSSECNIWTWNSMLACLLFSWSWISRGLTTVAEMACVGEWYVRRRDGHIPRPGRARH